MSHDMRLRPAASLVPPPVHTPIVHRPMVDEKLTQRVAVLESQVKKARERIAELATSQNEPREGCAPCVSCCCTGGLILAILGLSHRVGELAMAISQNFGSR